MSPLKHKNGSIIKTQRRSRRLFIALALVLVVAGSAFGFWRWQSDKQPDTQNGSQAVNYDPPSKEETQAAEDRKIERIENQPSQAPTPASQSALISEARQQGAGQDVVVTTQLKGNGWQRCELTLTRAGSPDVTETAGVLYQSSYSTCQGFALPADRFAAAGSWSASLKAVALDGSWATSEPVNVTINK